MREEPALRDHSENGDGVLVAGRSGFRMAGRKDSLRARSLLVTDRRPISPIPWNNYHIVPKYPFRGRLIRGIAGNTESTGRNSD